MRSGGLLGSGLVSRRKRDGEDLPLIIGLCDLVTLSVALALVVRPVI